MCNEHDVILGGPILATGVGIFYAFVLYISCFRPRVSRDPNHVLYTWWTYVCNLSARNRPSLTNPTIYPTERARTLLSRLSANQHKQQIPPASTLTSTTPTPEYTQLASQEHSACLEIRSLIAKRRCQEIQQLAVLTSRRRGS